MAFLAGDSSQCGKSEWSASGGDPGTRRSSQWCPGEGEMHGPVAGRKSDAARGGLSESRTGRLPCENACAEEEAVELGTVVGGSGDTV